jgi:hypothetical protein
METLTQLGGGVMKHPVLTSIHEHRDGNGRMTTRTISINRAPVLTLWAAVVAQCLGFDEAEALTLGKALAGLNAQAKGRRLGIFKPHEEKAKKAREKERGERFLIEPVYPPPAGPLADREG